MDIKQLTKKCSKCGEVKSLDEFFNDKRAKKGKRSWCKKCEIKQNKEWEKNNKEWIADYRKKYQQKNKEKLLAYSGKYREGHKSESSDYQKEWYKNNREKRLGQLKEYNRQHKNKILEYRKQWYDDNREKRLEQNKRYNKLHRNEINARLRERRETDLKYKLNKNISRVINFSLRDNKKGRHWENLMGYNYNDLIKRLKKTMPEGYTWQDYLRGELEIDHIIPKSIFNFTNSEQINFKRCWALSNLRLLPKKENRIKHNKLIKPFQPSLAI